MNKLLTLAAVACLVPMGAGAGEVFGTVKADDGPVGEGAEVAAKCGDQTYGPAKTDKSGTYRIVINQTGKCTFTVTHDAKSATIDVVSFDNAAQADVVLKPSTRPAS